MNDLSLDCKWKNLCQSCSSTTLSTRQALEHKRSQLEQGLRSSSLLPGSQNTDLIPIGPYGFRNRVDLIWSEGNLSFYDGNRQTFPLDACPLLTPALNEFFEKVRNFPFPMKKGSLRLRMSPTGLRGIWLDLANLDVKELFEEKNLLQKLSEIAVVEIGQRRKSLVFEGEVPKLRDPAFHSWTETFVSGRAVPLFSSVGSFSQTGTEANQKISAWIESVLDQMGVQSVIEFGSGTGTLTFPAAGRSRSVLACENDQLALLGLRQTLEQNPDFKDRIEIFPGDFQQKKFTIKNNYDTFLINPPRSGMGKFHQTLSQLPQLPSYGIYMSCFLDSFLKDALELKKLGYQLEKLAIVDQFPFTDHFEILSSWIR